MLQIALRKFFSKMFYPTNANDWYKSKGYMGSDDVARFADFIATQRTKGARFYNEFLSLQLTRQYISFADNKLDSVLIVPDQNVFKDKPGAGLYFVMFQGRGEYYESRFRDMAIQAKETGASVLGFNPKGVHSSSGKTRRLLDIVEDGIAVIEFLLQRGVRLEQIILQGNSLGAGVQEMVSEHYKSITGNALRQINSNSFRSLSAVIVHRYKLLFLESFFDRVLKYAEWEISPGADFHTTSPYRCHMRRVGDMTIAPGAEYHHAVDFEIDHDKCPQFYKETHKWLYDNSQIIYRGNSEKDPHELGLHRFDIKDGSEYISVYRFINLYLTSVKFT